MQPVSTWSQLGCPFRMNNRWTVQMYIFCVCAYCQAYEENGEQMAFYLVAVSLLEGESTENSNWCVTRKLSEFQALHRKLTEVPVLTWGHFYYLTYGCFFQRAFNPHFSADIWVGNDSVPCPWRSCYGNKMSHRAVACFGMWYKLHMTKL